MVEISDLSNFKGSKSHKSNKKYGILENGKEYVVIKEFIDFNNVKHFLGETWYFLSYSFLPYDNGLQWYVTPDKLIEVIIPLYLSIDKYSIIADNIGDYIKEKQS